MRGPDERYDERHPEPGDALLVVEVADSSLRFDQEVKVPLYGRMGVPEAWIVDLRHRRVHVHADPTDDGYATVVVRASGDTLVPAAFSEVEVAVSDLWP